MIEDIPQEVAEEIDKEEDSFRLGELQKRYQKALEEAVNNPEGKKVEFGPETQSITREDALNKIVGMTTETEVYNLPTIQELISFTGKPSDAYCWVDTLDLPEGFETAAQAPAVNLKTMDIKLFPESEKLSLKPIMHRLKP